MKIILPTFLVLTMSISTFGQNFTKQQTIDYIKEKMKIADPVFNEFEVGNNGETVFKWVNSTIMTEYRFNIRELEFSTGVNIKGDNIIKLVCNPGLNNCLQRSYRKNYGSSYPEVSFEGFVNLEMNSISGFDNVLSLKNAMVYLKVLSISDNINKTSAKRDPFLN